VFFYNPDNYLQMNGGFDWYSSGKPKNTGDVVIMQNV
jgi:hypothetical protein